MTCSMATDIVPERLELARELGADVIINCKNEKLKDRGQNRQSPNAVSLNAFSVLYSDGRNRRKWCGKTVRVYWGRTNG